MKLQTITSQWLRSGITFNLNRKHREIKSKACISYEKNVMNNEGVVCFSAPIEAGCLSWCCKSFVWFTKNSVQNHSQSDSTLSNSFHDDRHPWVEVIICKRTKMGMSSTVNISFSTRLPSPYYHALLHFLTDGDYLCSQIHKSSKTRPPRFHPLIIGFVFMRWWIGFAYLIELCQPQLLCRRIYKLRLCSLQPTCTHWKRSRCQQFYLNSLVFRFSSVVGEGERERELTWLHKNEYRHNAPMM